MYGEMSKVPIAVASVREIPFFISLNSKVWWKFTGPATVQNGYRCPVKSTNGAVRYMNQDTFVWVPTAFVA